MCDIPDVTDREVVAAVIAGDGPRFAVLVHRHNQRLFRTARAILGDEQEAEDVVQQAYLSAFEALPSFRGESQVASWLIRKDSLSRIGHDWRGTH